MPFQISSLSRRTSTFLATRAYCTYSGRTRRFCVTSMVPKARSAGLVTVSPPKAPVMPTSVMGPPASGEKCSRASAKSSMSSSSLPLPPANGRPSSWKKLAS